MKKVRIPAWILASAAVIITALLIIEVDGDITANPPIEYLVSMFLLVVLARIGRTK